MKVKIATTASHFNDYISIHIVDPSSLLFI